MVNMEFMPPADHIELVREKMLRVSVTLRPSWTTCDECDSYFFATMENACEFLDGLKQTHRKGSIDSIVLSFHDWNNSGVYWRSENPDVYARDYLDGMIGYQAILPPKNLEGFCIGIFLDSPKEEVALRAVSQLERIFQMQNPLKAPTGFAKKVLWSRYTPPPSRSNCPFDEVLRISKSLESRLTLFHQEANSLYLYTPYRRIPGIQHLTFRIPRPELPQPGNNA